MILHDPNLSKTDGAPVAKEPNVHILPRFFRMDIGTVSVHLFHSVIMRT